jgi:carboxyl-terminal processing protease
VPPLPSGAIGVRQPDGLTVVATVAPDSPAANAGIQPGDSVIREDGHSPPKTALTGFTSYGPRVTLQLRHRDQGPAFTVRLKAEPNQLSQYPDSRPLAGGIGYLDLPTFGYGPPQDQTYATDAQDAIRFLAPSASCGWIVDLRRDLGGDFYPMLAGVGPLLGDGQAGSFVTPAGLRIEGLMTTARPLG